jgi:PAS domain S-box-containing protein
VLLFLSTAAEPPDPEVLDLLDGVCAHLGRHVERRRADDLALALAAARRDFDRVIERVEDYVWTVEVLPDRSLGRIYTSPNVHGIYGGPLPRVEDMGSRVHPDDRPAFDEFNERVLAGEPAENEVRLVGADGVTRWVWTRAMPRTENGRKLIDGICTNVTERRELRERLLAEQQARNDLKDELVALVSHELRNPLGAIRSYGETLLDDPELSPEQRHLAEVIDRRGAHMQALIDDLLDLARVEAGRLHLAPAPMSAARLVRDVVQTQQPAAAAKSLTLTVDLPSDLAVRADPLRLRQVLDNLVANAVKYTPDGGRVTVAGRPGPDGAVVITVADTGIGIPAGEYPHLFDRFFRAANARDQGIPGTGLGLAISRAIVEAHGGTLDAAPAGGGGTVFTVRLP